MKVSVIMPVYNGEKYVAQAIESILNQTALALHNLELIIINDGSTDNTIPILEGFNELDNVRIVNLVENEGLVHALNLAISLCTGDYIVRMDADDIAHPERISTSMLMFSWFPKASLVCCSAQFIKYDGSDSEVKWKEDETIYRPEDIRSQLSKSNCIVHSSIVVRADVLKKYGYKEYQKGIEDYDLYLRLISDGHIMFKSIRKDIKYRLHDESVTSGYRKHNPFFRVAKCKLKFIAKRPIRKMFSGFVLKVASFAVLDIAKGLGKEAKKMIVR